MPGGFLAASPAGDLLPHRIENSGIVVRYFPFRHSRQDGRVHDPHRESDGSVAQFGPFHQLVQNSERQGFRRGHMAARDDHLQRGLGADQARQALRAAARGQNADQDFRQTHPGARNGYAVVAAERIFQAAAERVAVNRGHNRLRARFQRVMRAPNDCRASLAETANVRSGDKGPAGPDQHHGPHLGIGDAAVERIQYAFADARPERVHRRVVHHDDADGTLPAEMDDFGHPSPPPAFLAAPYSG